MTPPFPAIFMAHTMGCIIARLPWNLVVVKMNRLFAMNVIGVNADQYGAKGDVPYDNTHHQ